MWHFGEKKSVRGTWVETKAVQERKKASPKVEPREPLSQKEGKVFLNIGTQSTLVQICAYVLQYYCNTFLKGIRMQGGCFKSYMLWGCLNGPVLVAEELWGGQTVAHMKIGNKYLSKFVFLNFLNIFLLDFVFLFLKSVFVSEVFSWQSAESGPGSRWRGQTNCDTHIKIGGKLHSMKYFVKISTWFVSSFQLYFCLLINCISFSRSNVFHWGQTVAQMKVTGWKVELGRCTLV